MDEQDKKRVNTNLRLVEYCPKGSDVYSVVEKTAFFLHLKDTSKDPLINWRDAQRLFAQRMDSGFYANRGFDLMSGLDNVSELSQRFNEFLSRCANDEHRYAEYHLKKHKCDIRDTPLDNWVRVQDDLAASLARSQICEYYWDSN